jgi:hypothetical protein
MAIFDHILKSSRELENERSRELRELENQHRRTARQHERQVEQDLEKIDDVIAKLKEERTKVWKDICELLKSGRKAEAQRMLFFYKKYDIEINKQEKQKVFLKCQALQVSTAGYVNTTLTHIKTMATDHNTNPDELEESVNNIEKIGADIRDSDKVMNNAFDRDLKHMSQEVVAGDISYEDEELLAQAENESAAEVLGPKVADTSVADKLMSHDDISAGVERLKKIISAK